MSKHDRIREERKRLGYKQLEIANLCGVHRVQWGRYERGEQGFDGQPLRTFGELGADISYILTGTRTPAVEMQVLDKVTKATKTAQATGNVAGANNLAESMDDMLANMVRRGENAKNRAEALRQITLMLTDLDDEQFERAYQAISDIHSNKQPEAEEVQAVTPVQQTNSNNNFNDNKIGDVKDSVIGSNHISNSFNSSQGGFTDLQFAIIGAICGVLSLIFGSVANSLMHNSPTASLGMATLDLICLALALVYCFLAHTTTNCVPSKRKKAPST